MEFKHTDSKGEIALKIKVKRIEIFFLENVKIELKNEYNTLLFKIMLLLPIQRC